MTNYYYSTTTTATTTNIGPNSNIVHVTMQIKIGKWDNNIFPQDIIYFASLLK